MKFIIVRMQNDDIGKKNYYLISLSYRYNVEATCEAANMHIKFRCC